MPMKIYGKYKVSLSKQLDSQTRRRLLDDKKSLCVLDSKGQRVARASVGGTGDDGSVSS